MRARPCDSGSGRYRAAEKLPESVSQGLITPSYHRAGKTPRYYQEIAINRAIQAILMGKRRVLLTLATGTGKTLALVNETYRLMKSGVARRVLFLVDRRALAVRGQHFVALF